MRRLTFVFISSLLFVTTLVSAKDASWSELKGSADKVRLIIMADMGNEPDEQQQMMHLLLYANEFDLEGLIAVTGKYLGPHMRDIKRQRLYPELFTELINGYTKIYKSLITHKKNYPKPSSLHAVVASGQTGYGSKSIGADKTTEGSAMILKALERDDARPLVIVVNAGSNTLAQALLEYESKHTKEEFKIMLSKLRVVENGAQDDSGAYICNRYPGIYWVRSNHQAYCYGGPKVSGKPKTKFPMGPYTWEPYPYSGLGQHQWALEHIISGHSSYGALYPLRQFTSGAISFVEGGGTVPWLCAVTRGLSCVDRFDWGGWSGRYDSQPRVNYMSKHASVQKDEHQYKPFEMFGEQADKWVNPETGDEYDDMYTPVWRWRRAFFNDFKYRMDWCNKSFERANHNPVAVVEGNKSDAIMLVDVKVGSVLSIDATESYDPDGDKLQFSWYYYREAGDYQGDIEIENANGSKVQISVPKDAKGKQFHIILEVRDNDYKDAMYDYRRVVVSC